jgi:hypothetical protein
MDLSSHTHQWTNREKWLYWLSLIPFAVAFIGAFFLLTDYSAWLGISLLFFYFLINLFQAGCCVGCPYRGRYCPAIFGIYFSNIISALIYPTRDFDQKFFDRNAAAGEVMVLVTVIFPICWIAKTSWWLLPVYLLLILAHLVTFMPTQCDKCSYSETCPGGITWRVCRGWLGRERSE